MLEKTANIRRKCEMLNKYKNAVSCMKTHETA